MNNRPIKFRAWDKLAKRMVYAKYHMSLWFNGIVYNLQNGAAGDDFELQQFTGLRDKAGKEIYEGDILYSTDDEHYYPVVFHAGMFCVQVKDVFSPLHEYLFDGLVSGNIFENPKLLT